MPHIFIAPDNSLAVTEVYDERSVVSDIGGWWDAKNKVWKLTFTVENLDLLMKKLTNFTLSADMEQKVLEQQEREEKLSHFRDMAKSDMPVNLKVPGLKGSLYNYQRIGVMYAMTNGVGVLLADEMGLGKSIQCLSTAIFLKNKGLAKNALLVVPASLKYNWPLEIEKFTNEKYVVIDGTPEERIVQWLRTDVFFYVVNYEILLEDLFGGRTFKEKKEDTATQKQRKQQMKEKAERRQRILSPIRERLWDFIGADECFHPDTRLRMWNGSSRSISSIVRRKERVLVPAFNSETGEFEEKQVTNWFRGGKKQCLRLVCDGGTSYPTPDHKYIVPGGGESKVSDLNKGDSIVFCDENGISDVQLGALAGTLLGDSCLSMNCRENGRGNKRARISFTHGLCQKDYAEWKSKIFGGFETRVVRNKGYGKFSVVGHSKSIITMTDYCRFYIDGKKTVTDSWMELLTPLGLALWIMDDGSVSVNVPSIRSKKMIDLFDIIDLDKNIYGKMGRRKLQNTFGITESQSRRCSEYLRDRNIRSKYEEMSRPKTCLTLHTEGFPREQVELLIDMFRNKWGFHATLNKSRKKDKVYWTISFPQESSDRILKMISPFVPDCMMRKLGCVAGTEYSVDIDSDDFVVRRRARVSKIHSLTQYKKPVMTYNLEVEGIHRYVAGDAVVSNCHTIKHHASKRSRNLKQLHAKFRMALTGTPMDGRLEELHSVMGFVAPGLLGSKTLFFQRHVETDFWGRTIGYKRMGEVSQKIQPFFLRRLKRDVLKDLPDKIYENILVALTKEEEKIYKKLAEGGHEATEDAQAMVAIIRCKQFCNWPIMVDPTCKSSSKMDAFLDVIDEIVLQNGHKVLIFSQYVEMLDIIAFKVKEMGIKFLRIDGSTKKTVRAEMQKTFNEDKSISIMLGTEAMSTGLNFTAADYVINYDDNWSPAIMAQREDRAHRIGQRNVVTVVNFICKNTVEERIRDVIFAKSKITAQVLGDDTDELTLRRLGPKDVAKLL